MLNQLQIFETATLETIGLNSNDYQKILDEEISKLQYLPTLLTCIKLNLFSTQTEKEQPSQFQVKMLNMVYDMGLVSEMDNNLLSHFLKNKKNGIIFHRPALLQLIFELSRIGESFNSLKVKSSNKSTDSSFIKAYLAANRVYNNITLSTYQTGLNTETVVISLFETMLEIFKNIKNSIIFYQPVLMQQLFKIFNNVILQYRNYVEARVLQAQHKLVKLGYTYLIDDKRVFGKTKLLNMEQFFNKNKFLLYRKEFIDNNQISIDDWFKCSSILFSRLRNEFNNRLTMNLLDHSFIWDIDSIVENFVEKSIFIKFLKLVTIKPNSVIQKRKNSNDPLILTLISKPILLLDNNKILIIDPRYFIENMIEGPIFLLKQNNKNNTNDPFQDYGNSCELFAYSFLNKYNDKLKLIEKPKIIFSKKIKLDKSSSGKVLCDILIFSGSSLAIIEVKGVILSNQAIFNENPKDYLKEIIQKYLSSNDERPKGLKQLKNSIDCIIKKTYITNQRNKFLNNITEIMPILLLRDDEQVNVSADYFADKFNGLFKNQELPKTGNFKYGNLTVHSLITISINHLLMLAEINLPIDLLNLFQEYSIKSPTRKQLFTDFLATRQPNFVCFPTNQMLTSQAASELLTGLGLVSN